MESVNSPTGSASLPFFCGTTSPKTKNPKRLKAVWDFMSEFSLAGESSQVPFENKEKSVISSFYPPKNPPKEN